MVFDCSTSGEHRAVAPHTGCPPQLGARDPGHPHPMEEKAQIKPHLGPTSHVKGNTGVHRLENAQVPWEAVVDTQANFGDFSCLFSLQ